MSTGSTIERTTRSPEQTVLLGAQLGAACEGGEVLVLTGDLGAGKTQLVRGLARGLGCEERSVRSPSYSLCHHYPGRLALNHFDVYFTEAAEDLERNELFAACERGEVVAVEWGERFSEALPEDCVRIWLFHEGEQTRCIRLEAAGPRSQRLLAAAGLDSGDEESSNGGG